ncbi:MAG: DUF503 domain-containing protein [bacterium]
MNLSSKRVIPPVMSVAEDMIGVCEIHIHLPAIASLKGKRKIVKGLKDRIRSRFNVSVAELDALDKWQRSVIGIACINKDRVRIDQVLNHVVGVVESTPDVVLTDYFIEFI